MSLPKVVPVSARAMILVVRERGSISSSRECGRDGNVREENHKWKIADS